MTELLDDAVALSASTKPLQMDAGRHRMSVGGLLPGVGRVSRKPVPKVCSALRLRALRGGCHGM